MSNIVYCAKCGRTLPLHRKPMPHFGRIIELIEPHKCGKVVCPDLGKPVDIPTELSEDNEFVQKLNDLNPPAGDKRSKEHVRDEVDTSTAPASLRDLTKFPPSVPEGEGEEVGDD